MKKIALFALVVGFVLSGFSATAQRYLKKDIIINAGTSFLLINLDPINGYEKHRSIPPITVNAEFGVSNEFAVGPYIGYFGRTYENPTYKNRFAVYAFGARGTYHAVNLINDLFYTEIDEERVDIYVTALVGYELYGWNYDDNVADNNAQVEDGGFVFGPLLGVRYYLGKRQKVGIFAEGGRGAFGYITTGFTARVRSRYRR